MNYFGVHPRTGDLARYRSDGNIEFLGRIDLQVKVRGFRVEPGEIEARLSQHPDVREAVVLTREDGPGDKGLVAYIVPARRPGPAGSALRGFLRQTLPEYMVPSVVVTLDALPLTSNGKVDRRALPRPSGDRPEAIETFVAPQNPLQRQLAQIWEDLLGVRPIGITDSFFDLGGHSLLAVRLFDRIESAFGRRIPLRILFADPTIAHLAQALDRPDTPQSSYPLMTIQPGGSRRPFFFIPADVVAGGFFCVQLAHYLGTDQPFHVLHPHGFAGRPVPPTIEAMAAEHLQTLRAFQPDGPYLLGANCAQGPVVFELAQQLYAQGQSVERLVIVRGTAPQSYAARLEAANRVALTDMDRHIADVDQDIAAAVRDVVNALWTATEHYKPTAYPGRLALLWPCGDIIQCPDDPTMGWGALAKEVEVHVIPGSHLTIVLEDLAGTAEGLKACLGLPSATA